MPQPRITWLTQLVCALLVVVSPVLQAAGSTETRAQQDECLLHALHQADDNVTVHELRQRCAAAPQTRSSEDNALQARLALEHETRHNPFVITPYRRNYLMPFSYWSNPQWNDPAHAGDHLDSTEAKFQLSLKAPIYDNFWQGSTLYAAFTGTFYWQAYNGAASHPFREINYTPELFLSKPVDWQFGPVQSELLEFGFRHDSNGRDVPASRSWNRLYLRYISQVGPYYVSVMPWYRIPEHDKENPLETSGDDNPDIERYMGNFQLRIARTFGNQVVELMLRNNLRSENKGAAQVSYSFPINDRFKGLVQVFSGYGDSLINYNDYETRVSFGILLTDML